MLGIHLILFEQFLEGDMDTTMFDTLKTAHEMEELCALCYQPLFKEVFENGVRKKVAVVHGTLICAKRMVSKLNID